MLARHPKTGAPIRIIKTESSIWRSRKTLAWLPKGASASYPWDVGVTSSAAATGNVQVVVCLGPPEEEKAWLQSDAARGIHLIAVPRNLAASIGVERLVELKLGNLICLEEISHLYPYVDAWDGTVDGAKRTVGTMLRYSRNLLEPAEQPAPLIFITQTYRTINTQRQKELDECLTRNLECPYISRVVLLNETENAPKHPKIEEHVIGKRITYASVIRWIYESAPEDAIVVFANADIYIDETWRHLWSIDMTDVALALLRWDVKAGKAALFGPRADSQDTWAISAASVKKRTWDWNTVGIPFGQGGCDNAIAFELFKQKFLVVNPALTLKTYHLHESGLRTYDPRNIVDKNAYLYIQPSGIHEMKPVYDFPTDYSIDTGSFDRTVRGPLSPTQAKTYAVMTSKTSGTTIEVGLPNTYCPGKIAISRFKNVFNTREGLVFTKDSAMIGPSAVARKDWSSTPISSLSSSIPVKLAVVAHLSREMATTPALYALNYLGKVLLLRKGAEEGEFWAPKAMLETLKLFQWGPSLPVISYDAVRQAWCDEAVVWPHLDADRVTREEVGALRDNLRIQLPLEDRLVVVGSDWITSEVIDAIEAHIPVTVLWSDATPDVIADALVGAAGLVTHGPLGNWAWMLPAGAFVFEIQCEMTPSIDLLHLCGAAELDHRLYIVPKGKPVIKQLTDMTTALTQGFAVNPTGGFPKLAAKAEELPIIHIPTPRPGFFGHAGDSFREMATLWAERGYVKAVPTDYGHVRLGDTVLYDRPTYAWLDAEPVNGPMLVGNPAPRTPSQRSWTFWPRRPRLVEKLADLELPRTKGLVFYGRSENAVQRLHRVGLDWASVCDEFVHVDGAKPYPLSHEEYLRALATAKWGLCLAGFGRKCHREIECMAMGCVPIVAPEVDMENYADPPVEGVQFFRAEGPEAAAAIIKDESKWVQMSAACRDWWRRNASAEGSWRLTAAALKVSTPDYALISR